MKAVGCSLAFLVLAVTLAMPVSARTLYVAGVSYHFSDHPDGESWNQTHVGIGYGSEPRFRTEHRHQRLVLGVQTDSLDRWGGYLLAATQWRVRHGRRMDVDAGFAYGLVYRSANVRGARRILPTVLPVAELRGPFRVATVVTAIPAVKLGGVEVPATAYLQFGVMF